MKESCAKSPPGGRRFPAPILLGLPALLLTLTGCAARLSPDPRNMSFPPLEIAPPAVQRLALANGTVLFLLEDHEVPIVDVKVLVRTGAVFEPEGKAGLAELTGRVLRTGGAGGLAPEEINGRVEDMGAHLESSIGREAGSATLSVLKEDLEAGIDLLARMLRRPAFAAGEVEKARKRALEELRRSNDDPDSIAFRQLRPLLYGRDPRGRLVTPGTLAPIERSDLEAFHARHYHPDRLIVGVSGDFDVSRFTALWLKYFADWEKAPGPPEPFPRPLETPPKAIYTVAKDLPQSTIVMARFAPAKGTEEYFAFSMMNYILGGAGFNSRLTEEIRSNRGLAYSVGSFYRAEPGYGVLSAYCRTGPGTTREAAGLLLEVGDRMAAEGITAPELEWARQSILNGLIFSLDSSAQIVSRRMAYEYDGLPEDFLEVYAGKISHITLAEVNEAAGSHLSWKSGPMVVVGREEALTGTFDDLGKVIPLPLEKF